MGKRVHAENLGYNIGPSSRVLATGGAAANKEILQVLSDVFNAPVYTLETENSASLGAAYQAKHGLVHETTTFQEVVKNAAQYILATEPNPDADQVNIQSQWSWRLRITKEDFHFIATCWWVRRSHAWASRGSRRVTQGRPVTRQKFFMNKSREPRVTRARYFPYSLV